MWSFGWLVGEGTLHERVRCETKKVLSTFQKIQQKSTIIIQYTTTERQQQSINMRSKLQQKKKKKNISKVGRKKNKFKLQIN